MILNRHILIVALALPAAGVFSDGPRFADIAAVSIRYELGAHPAGGTKEEVERGYPHLLRVFLQIRNTHDADITWVGNSVNDIEAHLIDNSGQLAATAPTFASIKYSDRTMVIPHGSSMEWMISHMGVSMIGDRENCAALIVGGKGWLIPLESLRHYSLALRVKGLPGTRIADPGDVRERVLLFDIPATPITAEGVPNQTIEPTGDTRSGLLSRSE